MSRHIGPIITEIPWAGWGGPQTAVERRRQSTVYLTDLPKLFRERLSFQPRRNEFPHGLFQLAERLFNTGHQELATLVYFLNTEIYAPDGQLAGRAQIFEFLVYNPGVDRIISRADGDYAQAMGLVRQLLGPQISSADSHALLTTFAAACVYLSQRGKTWSEKQFWLELALLVNPTDIELYQRLFQATAEPILLDNYVRALSYFCFADNLDALCTLAISWIVSVPHLSLTIYSQAIAIGETLSAVGSQQLQAEEGFVVPPFAQYLIVKQAEDSQRNVLLLHYYRAFTYMRLGQWPEALADLRTIIGRSPQGDDYKLAYQVSHIIVSGRQSLPAVLVLVEHLLQEQPNKLELIELRRILGGTNG
ncbi:MAG: hypothetical protein ABIE84_02985 [bacterium]